MDVPGNVPDSSRVNVGDCQGQKAEQLHGSHHCFGINRVAQNNFQLLQLSALFV